MYRVAVIQNQSEAFELSYGNVIKMLQEHFPKYTWDLFSTEDGMLLLVANLEHYNAVIFTSNALSDISVRGFWLDSRCHDIFEGFLHKGKGILILHQIKMIEQNYSFLGEEWTVRSLKRAHGSGSNLDRPVDGKLSINIAHLVLNYPEPIDLTRSATQARTNPNLPVLYFYSLEPIRPEYWISVIQDTTYTPQRHLLLVSGAHTEGRIVVTSLLLDWQAQLELLTNLITYVVEGTQSVTVIQRVGKRPYEFEYMLSYLNIHKVAYREYWSEKLDDAPIATGVHSVAVISPAWPAGEITPEVAIKLKQRLRPEGKLIYFDTLANHVPAVTAIGGQIPFKVQYRDSIMSLKSAYDYNLGLWDGSFFRTMHVLEALATFGESLNEYKIPTLRYVFEHDLDGSYDGTFIATCEMARLYYIFGETNRFKSTVAWIQRELATRQKSAPDVVQAYAIFRLCKLKVNDTTIEMLRGIIDTPTDSLINRVRYLQTAIAYGFIEQIRQLASTLKDQQREDGSWGLEQANRAMLTATVVETLIQARPWLSPLPATIPSIEEVILKGITYLHSFNLQRIADRQQAATVAMALQAIYRFSNDISLPIEDFAASQSLIQSDTRNIAAIDAATKLTSTLQTKISTLHIEKAELEKAHSQLSKEHSHVRHFRTTAIIGILSLIFFLIVSVSMVAYAAFTIPGFFNGLIIVFFDVIGNWLIKPFGWLIVVLIIILIVIMLRSLDLLPRFVFQIIQSAFSLLNINLKDSKLEKSDRS